MTTALDKIKKQKNVVLKFGLIRFNEIYIELSSDSDPHGKCIETIRIRWVPVFGCGDLAPIMKLESQDLKFVAMYPEIIRVFLKMKHGSISMHDVLKGLSKIGTRKDLSYEEELATDIADRRLAAMMQPDWKPLNQEVNISGNLYAGNDYLCQFSERYYTKLHGSIMDIPVCDLEPEDLRKLADRIELKKSNKPVDNIH